MLVRLWQRISYFCAKLYFMPLSLFINSFSFKNGYPDDTTGTGGGFVFDCRGLDNPGRYEPFKALTGVDEVVQDFLLENSEIEEFTRHIFSIVDITIDDYLKRERTHLTVNFGCTGGRHRSVFSAILLSNHVKAKFPEVNVVLRHLQKESGAWDREFSSSNHT